MCGNNLRTSLNDTQRSTIKSGLLGNTNFLFLQAILSQRKITYLLVISRKESSETEGTSGRVGHTAGGV